MPTYQATSPETGVTHTINFSAEPDAQTLEAAVKQFDAPILALKRQNQNTQLTQLLGGEPVNAQGQTYSQTQGPSDQLLIRRELLNQQQSELGKEALKAQELANTTPVGSFGAGALTTALAPVGLAATGLQALIAKTLGANANARELQPLMGTQGQQTIADIVARAAQNPTAGTFGTIAPIVATGGIGGVSQNIAKALQAGSLAEAAPFLAQAGTQAGTAGAINAGINTGIRTLSGASTTPLDVAADVAFGLLGGRRNAGVSTPTTLATGNLKGAIAERGILKQPLNAATTEALGIAPIQGAADIVPVVKSSVLEANGGVLPQNTAPEVVLQDAAKFKINQYVDGLKAAGDQGMAHSVSSLEDAMFARVNQLHPTFGDKKVQAIVDSVKAEHPKLFDQEYVSPVEGQQVAVQINREVNAKNPNRVPKSSEFLNAETALSQELSRQGREMYQAATGTNGTPNQDWGIITQALGDENSGLIGELKRAQNADAGRTPEGTAIPKSIGGLIGKALKKIGGRALIPTQNENVVNSFQRVLNEGEARPDVGTLDPQVQQEFIQKYTPQQSTTATNVVPVAPAAPSPYEQQLQRIINSLPASERGSNERAVAESILKARGRYRAPSQ